MKDKVMCEPVVDFAGHLDESKHNFGLEPVALLNDKKSFEVGDLVWAKVKSHPWWPGQIFNAVHASNQARSLEKPGRILVAFYGDHTFAWLEQSQILDFEPYFEEKVKVTNTLNFQRAISEALDEVCRRAQLELQCQCCKSLLDNEHNSDDLEDGVQCTHDGHRLHKDESTSKEILNARRTLSFLKDLASSPCKPCSSVDASVLHGHLLGIRTGMGIWAGIFADDRKDGTLEEGLFASTGKDETTEDLVFDSTARAVTGTGESQSQVECRKCGNAGYKKRIFPLEDCERAKRRHVPILNVDNEEKERATNPRGAAGQTMYYQSAAYGMIGSCNESIDQRRRNASLQLSRERICFFRAKLELRRQYRGSTPSLNELSSFCDDKATHFLLQVSEALQFVAVDPLCHHGAYDMMATKMAVFLKFRDAVFQKSAGYGCHLQSPGQKEMQVKDAPHFSISAGDHDSPNLLVPKTVRYWRPTSQKQVTLDPHYNQSENSETLNSTKDPPAPHLQCMAHAKASHKGKKLSSDKEGLVLGMNFEGVSQAFSRGRERATSQQRDVHELLIEAHRKTSDITKEAPAKLDVHELLIGARKRKSDFTKETPSKLDVHELLLEAQKKNFKCAKEAPVKVLEKALKTSAVRGPIYSDAHSRVRVEAKQHLATRSLKGSDEGFSEGALKMFPFEGQVFSEANADSSVSGDHFSRANTDKGISVEHFSDATPGIGVRVDQESTTKPCKHYFHRVLCGNVNMEGYSQMCDNRASSGQLHDKGKFSARLRDDDASSQLPVDLWKPS